MPVYFSFYNKYFMNPKSKAQLSYIILTLQFKKCAAIKIYILLNIFFSKHFKQPPTVPSGTTRGPHYGKNYIYRESTKWLPSDLDCCVFHSRNCICHKSLHIVSIQKVFMLTRLKQGNSHMQKFSSETAQIPVLLFLLQQSKKKRGRHFMFILCLSVTV